MKQLCLNTLNYIQKMPGNSCLISNEFGTMLRQCGAEVLPVMEEVMVDVVRPALESHYEEHGIPDLDAIIREGPPFSGLDEFLGSYWVICGRTDADHAIKFIRSMPMPIIFEAVLAMPIFFDEKRPLFEFKLPSNYQGFLKELIDSGVPEYMDVASRTHNKLA